MLKHKRKGVALVWVILMAALVLVTIVGISIKVVPEKQILNARSYSQRALEGAETGIDETLYNLRNNKIKLPTPTVPYSSTKTYQSATPPTIVYEVKVQEEISGEYTFYSLGTVKNPSTDEILARKAIKVVYSGYSLPKGFALYSYTSISFKNSNSVNITGSIFANDSLDLKNVNINGAAYLSHNGILGDTKGANISGGIHTDSPEINFPKIDVQSYIDKANAFRDVLKAPYDGSVSEYPNLNISNRAAYVAGVIQGYLGAPLNYSDMVNVFKFYDDVMKPGGDIITKLNGLEIGQLQLNAKNIVYYVEADKINKDGTYPVTGTIIIDGDLLINGNITIGDPNHPENTAVIVRGNVNFAGGTANINGLLYIAGGGKFTGNGTFNCNGSVIAEGEISVGGNVDVNFHENNVPIEYPVPLGVNLQPVASSWREISYDDFP